MGTANSLAASSFPGNIPIQVYNNQSCTYCVDLVSDVETASHVEHCLTNLVFGKLKLNCTQSIQRAGE